MTLRARKLLKDTTDTDITNQTAPNSILKGNVSKAIKDLADSTIMEYDPLEIYVSGQKLIYLGSIYQANATTVAGENPISTPSKWDIKVGSSDWVTATPVGTALTLDLKNNTNPAIKYTEAGPVTWTLSNVIANKVVEVILQVTLGSTSHTITLPANFFEEGVTKSSIVLTGVSGQVKTIQLIKNGTNWEIFYPTGGSGAIYNLTSPTTVTVGNLPSGTNIAGLTTNRILELILTNAGLVGAGIGFMTIGSTFIPS